MAQPDDLAVSTAAGVTLTQEQQRAMRRRSLDLQVLPYFGGSVFCAAALLLALAWSMPPSGVVPDEAVARARVYFIQQYLQAAVLREAPYPVRQRPEAVSENHEGGTGTRGRGVEGKLGQLRAAQAPRRYQLARQRHRQPSRVALPSSLAEAEQFGLLGLLRTELGDDSSHLAPWRDTSVSAEADTSLRGNLWARELGIGYGYGGLALSGTGEGGGGRGAGIGLDTFGGLGHGAGTGGGYGFGSGEGSPWTRRGWAGCGGSGERLMGGDQVVWSRTIHNEKCTGMGEGGGGYSGSIGLGRLAQGARRLAPAPVAVSGRLPAELIQRIVRQNFGRFRYCYQQGLEKNPSLQGRVAVRFVIARDGSVSHAASAGSDLPDGAVVRCVVQAYYALSFPEPEGGIVHVTYPITFSPD